MQHFNTLLKHIFLLLYTEFPDMLVRISMQAYLMTCVHNFSYLPRKGFESVRGCKPCCFDVVLIE